MVHAMLKRAIILVLLGMTHLAISQSAPSVAAAPSPTNRPTVRVIPPYSSSVVTAPQTPGTKAPKAAPAIPPVYRPLPDGMLAWDSETQEATVKFGTPQAFTAFTLTNISKEPITITSVRTSCGCTVPKLPPMPWTLDPGTNGTIQVTMNLAGKKGTVIKTVTVTTDKGFKTLYVKTKIEEAPAGVMGESERMRNLQIAMANRQAVFHGDCASCHATPALNKTGGELFKAACAICHEAEHRSTMVPDLHNLQKPTDADFWRTWITSSADGKLMPAFAIENGGILNATQINSLVDYLVNNFPSQQAASLSPASPSNAPSAPTAH